MPDQNVSMYSTPPTQHLGGSRVPPTDGLAHEPLAIIGIGCHLPGGATSPQAFWELLCSGVDATREVPADRWDARKFYDPDLRKPGKTQACRGGFLERIDQF